MVFFLAWIDMEVKLFNADDVQRAWWFFFVRMKHQQTNINDSTAAGTITL